LDARQCFAGRGDWFVAALQLGRAYVTSRIN
jgi:hypothetical protein